MMYPFGFNDSFFESPYNRSRVQRRRAEEEEARRQRKKVAEEAKRRSELEKYYRMKAREQEEKERQRQQQQEYIRQLELQQRQKEEEEQRRAYEAARIRREKAEAEARRRRRRQQRNRNFYRDETDKEENEPEFKIVRGRDGRLYQVRNPLCRPPDTFIEEESSCSEEEDEPEFRIVRGPDGRLYRVRNETQSKQKTKPVLKSRSVNDQNNQYNRQQEELRSNTSSRNIPVKKSTSSMDVEGDDENATPVTSSSRMATPASPSKKSHKGKKGKKNKKKKITIVVEDASDSEYDDEFDSPWRNRRPSPGEWLEPVENFQ